MPEVEDALNRTYDIVVLTESAPVEGVDACSEAQSKSPSGKFTWHLIHIFFLIIYLILSAVGEDPQVSPPANEFAFQDAFDVIESKY